MLATESLWECQLADTIDARQNACPELPIYIWGWTEDGEYALVVWGDNVTIAHRMGYGAGRFECLKHHLNHHIALYSRRFPRR